MYKQLKEWKRGNACRRLWWEILLSLFTKIFTHSLLIKLNVSHKRNWLYWILNGVWFSEFVWWKYSLYCLIPSIIRHDSTVIEFTKMPLVTLISARSPLLLFPPSARPVPIFSIPLACPDVQWYFVCGSGLLSALFVARRDCLSPTQDCNPFPCLLSKLDHVTYCQTKSKTSVRCLYLDHSVHTKIAESTSISSPVIFIT